MSDFEAIILNGTGGGKVLKIYFKKEELGDLLKLLDKKIKIKQPGYGH